MRVAARQLTEAGPAGVEAQRLAGPEAKSCAPAPAHLAEARARRAPVLGGERRQRSQREAGLAEPQAQLEVLLGLEARLVAADVGERVAAIERQRRGIRGDGIAVADSIEVAVAGAHARAVLEPLLDPS